MKSKMSNNEKIAYYEVQSANWLATANQLKERHGDNASEKTREYVEECYQKSTRYLMLANRRIEDGK